MSKKGYTFFDGDKELNINIIGVRRDNAGTNTFDDFIVVIYKNANLKDIIKVYPATTDPGQYWLENPMNPRGTAVLARATPNHPGCPHCPRGTAVLVPGQYRGTWKLGKHQNNYEALVQRKTVKVWRDNTKDSTIDYDSFSNINEGFFGINIHRSNPYDKSYVVNRWSAGCQVFQSVHDFDEFMDICRRSSALYGNSFSYTLLTEQDLREHLKQ